MNDIVEKTNKFRSDDIDKFASSAVTSKRMPPLVKKMYELETAITQFRSDVSRAVMLSAKAGGDTAASDDPVDTSVGEVKPELPTIASAIANAVVKVEAIEPVSDGDGDGKKPKKKTYKAEKAKSAKADEKPTVAEPAPAAAPPAVVVPTVDDSAAPAVESPSNESEKAQAKKGGRPKKAVVEKATSAPSLAPALAPAPVAAPYPAPAAPSPATTLIQPEKPIAVAAAESSVEAEDDSKAPLAVRRKKIPKAVRILVWNLHVGSHKGEDRCMCCKEKKIDVANFHCGHVIAEAKGGDLTIKNLRPICSACNSAMGTRSMNEFTKEFFGWEI